MILTGTQIITHLIDEINYICKDSLESFIIILLYF